MKQARVKWFEFHEQQKCLEIDFWLLIRDSIYNIEMNIELWSNFKSDIYLSLSVD